MAKQDPGMKGRVQSKFSEGVRRRHIEVTFIIFKLLGRGKIEGERQ